jgi:transposase
VLAGLRALLAKNATFRAAADILSVSKSRLHRIAQRHKLPHRRPGLPPKRRQLVTRLVAKGYSGPRIAREAGVGRKTAWRYQTIARFRSLINQANTPQPCKPWRCPAGGELLNVTICIAHGTRKPGRTGTGKRPRH